MEKEKKQLNFFKRFYISLFKIKDYDKVSKTTIKDALYYATNVILIMAIIYSLILTFQTEKKIGKLKTYLEENLPEISYKDGIVTSEKEERTVLDDDLVKANFGGQIVIDLQTDYETIINEYKDGKEATIIITKDKCATINEKSDVSEYEYPTVIKNYLGQEKNEFNKEYLMSLVDSASHSFAFYLMGYLISYTMANLIVIMIYALIIAIIIFAICQIRKIKVKFKELYVMGLHAQTITIIGYLIMTFSPIIIARYVQIILLIISGIYLYFATNNITKTNVE